ncbi:MAG: hypothetical protein AAGM38_03085 [Pseudomonadota bacterium]
MKPIAALMRPLWARAARIRRSLAARFGARAAAPALTMTIAALGAALAAGALSARPASAQAGQDCAEVGSVCGAMVKSDCLARLGAGAMAVGDPAGRTCAGQLSLYRGCLVQAAERCGGARGPQRTQAYISGLTTDLCAIGVWTGPIIEPGFDSYTVRLEIGMRNDRPFARARYPELSCSSRGDHLEGPENGRILFREVVTDNRERCADGRYAVTCMADGRLHWRWFRDNGEFFDAILSR